MIHLLIPMSGQGVRYQKAGYQVPKPLVPVSGHPMIERVLKSFPSEWPCTFVMAENHRATELPDLLKKLRPTCRLSYVPEHKEGPLRAIEEGIKTIAAEQPVFVSYCDYGMIWDSEQFEFFVEQSQCDACVVSYKGFHAHYLSPVTYAYSRLEGERVVEMKEKGSFTSDRENEYASSGGYYFRSARILAEAMSHQRKIDLKMNGEFYTSLTIEALLRMKKNAHVRIFEIPAFFQWGTPEDLQRFEYWENTFANYNHTSGLAPGAVSQVLMPMAGAGSRFQGITDVPKPLIAIDGKPMFERALGSLPQGKTTIVGLKSFANALKGFNSVLLDKTPTGQALSTQAGVASLDPNKDVLVSSCDHSIVLSSEKWSSFISKPQCDAAIFTVKGFPGAKSKPEAFAYVVPTEKAHFPIVKSVSVKKAVSQNPEQDALLVGTFWFSSAAVLDKAIAQLVKSDVRVRGELYLDSVFELLLKDGKTVRMIPLDGYINWGDPDSLAESLYWYEVFCGRRLTKRSRWPTL